MAVNREKYVASLVAKKCSIDELLEEEAVVELAKRGFEPLIAYLAKFEVMLSLIECCIPPAPQTAARQAPAPASAPSAELDSSKGSMATSVTADPDKSASALPLSKEELRRQKKEREAEEKRAKKLRKEREKQEKEEAKARKKALQQQEKERKKAQEAEQRMAKRATIACNVFTCGTTEFYAPFAFPDNYEGAALFTRLFECLTWDVLPAGHAEAFKRMIVVLATKRPNDVAAYVMSRPDCPKCFLVHLYQFPIAEVLVTLHQNIRVHGMARWFADHYFVPHLVDRMRPTYRCICVTYTPLDTPEFALFPGDSRLKSILARWGLATGWLRSSSGERSITDLRAVPPRGHYVLMPGPPVPEGERPVADEAHFVLDPADWNLGLGDDAPAAAPPDGPIRVPRVRNPPGFDADDIENLHFNASRVLQSLVQTLDRFEMTNTALGKMTHCPGMSKSLLRYVIAGARRVGEFSSFVYTIQVVAVLLNRHIATPGFNPNDDASSPATPTTASAPPFGVLAAPADSVGAFADEPDVAAYIQDHPPPAPTMENEEAPASDATGLRRSMLDASISSLGEKSKASSSSSSSSTSDTSSEDGEESAKPEGTRESDPIPVPHVDTPAIAPPSISFQMVPAGSPDSDGSCDGGAVAATAERREGGGSPTPSPPGSPGSATALKTHLDPLKTEPTPASSTPASPVPRFGRRLSQPATDTTPRPPFLMQMRAMLPELAQLLGVFPDKAMPTTAGILRPPLGSIRLKMVRLIVRLLLVEDADMDALLVRLGIIKNVIDLFFQYPLNNFLHETTVDMVQILLRKQNQTMARVLIDVGLPMKILNAVVEFEHLAQGKRPGYMGFLTQIATLMEAQPLLHMLLSENMEWSIYVKGALVDALNRESGLIEITSDALARLKAMRPMMFPEGMLPINSGAPSSTAPVPFIRSAAATIVLARANATSAAIRPRSASVAAMERAPPAAAPAAAARTSNQGMAGPRRHSVATGTG